jgi:hypothetical protein
MQSVYWRKCRLCLRWFRRAALVAVVVLICAFVWCDRVGVPDFLKRRLVESLRERGVELEFSRMRYILFRGLIAENVRVGHAAETDGPAFSAGEVRLELDNPAMLHGRLQLDGLMLNRGRFVLPLSPTNALQLDDIQTELRFQGNDTWSLDNFKAGFAGAQLALSGDVAHAPEIRGWEIFRGAKTSEGLTLAQLQAFSGALGKIHFTGTPQLNLNFSGDARDVHSFNIRLTVIAPAVQSPWAGARNIQFTARLTAPAGAPTNFNMLPGFWTNLQPFRLAWTARATELRSDRASADTVECDGIWHAPELMVTKLSARQGAWTPGLTVRNLEATADLIAPTNGTINFDSSWSWWTNLQPYRLAWTARAAELRSGNASADTVECDGVWHAPELTVTKLSTRLGAWAPGLTVSNLEAAANLTTPTNGTINCDFSWSWWTNLQPYQLAWTARLAQLKSDPLNADAIACGGFWSAPELALTNLSAELGGGRLDARAGLNVATREFGFTNSSRFDLHAVAAWLTDKTRERLAEFSWTQPPSLRAAGSLVLPAWTNRQPDWRDEVQPTIRLNGELAFTNGTVSGVAIDSAAAAFSYSNLVWQVPALAIAQSKTRLEISGSENDATRDYHWRVRGALDPECLRPFLTASNAARGFSIVQFSAPVNLDAEVWGRLYDYDGIGATGRVALTNFTLRGQSMDSVTGELSYTNRVLEFSHLNLWRGAQTMTADLITLDFNQRLIIFKNGYSTADPVAITRAIGPKTAHIMEPYHFLEPPTVLVEGCLPLRDMNGVRDVAGTDLRFDVVGGVPFQCLKLNATRVTGTIRWTGEMLVLTNIAAELYGGTGNGFASFDFRAPHEGADYQVTAAVTNINLRALAADLASRTNHLEGALSGQVVVTRADTRDWRTLDGFGQARLRDGLIWDIPLFGLLSPVLNSVSPGLGDSRATDAQAKFAVTNGVIFSDLLEINTAMTRLQYSGTLDLRGNMNARVTAELLHNVWGVGPILRPFLWPVSKVFEYKVTGTLDNPSKEPVYVPKLLLLPLHPIRTLEGLMPGGENLFSPTNAPPNN